MKLVFFGTPQFAADIMTGLQKKGVEIAAVVTAPDAKVGRKQILTPSPVKQLALDQGIPSFTPERVKDPEFIQELQQITADAWLVVAYGKILPQSFLDLMREKVINIHPSRLPQYRGPAPMQAALRNGDSSTATTLMVMDRKMDHGPIIAQREVLLDLDETYPELADRMVGECVELVSDHLPKYLAGDIQAREQDHDQATYVSLLTKQDGLIDWNTPAHDLYNQYRAYTPWPGTYSHINRKKINLEFQGLSDTELTPGSWQFDQELIVGTESGSVKVSRIKPEGKSWQTPQQFIQSYGPTGSFTKTQS